MTQATASAWFFARAGQRQGPVDIGALRQLLASGQVTAGDLVWREGMAEWMAAGRLAELWPGGVVPAGPPPMPGDPIGYYAPAPASGGAANDMGQDAGMRLLLPVGRSLWAIAAGYLGLFSVLLIPAPIALAISIIAIVDIRKHPDRHGMGRAVFGLVMGLVFTVLLLVMVVAVAGNHRR